MCKVDIKQKLGSKKSQVITSSFFLEGRDYQTGSLQVEAGNREP